jgi:hypothetical protein
MKNATLIFFAIAFPMLAVSWFLLKSSFYALLDIVHYVRSGNCTKEEPPVLHRRIEPTF